MAASGRVLVVDDEVEIREIVAEVLADEGYEVVTAPDGAAALELVEQSAPSAVVLDIRMPVMDGWQFAREYRQRFNRSAPIIVMTAAQHAFQWCAEIRAEGCLPKPFDLDQLLQVVGEHAAGG